ncbi:hypothetical protein [Shewanella sp. NIFS-20-20]|nr:hypothetical protein [Shewanella sp. NIFS-20-20]MBV7314078.1 hypothetical protein [Shewanella sp. NIFS-20-20]
MLRSQVTEKSSPLILVSRYLGAGTDGKKYMLGNSAGKHLRKITGVNRSG